MNGDQFSFGYARIALIAAFIGAAIGEEVLGGGSDVIGAKRLAGDQFALQPQRHRPAIAGNQTGV